MCLTTAGLLTSLTDSERLPDILSGSFVRGANVNSQQLDCPGFAPVFPF